MLTPEVPKWVDPVRLAQENGQLQGVLPLTEFSEVVGIYPVLQGTVTFKVGVNKKVKGYIGLEGTVELDLVVLCARCMQPLNYRKDSTFLLFPVVKEEMDKTPPEHDIVVMEEGKVSLYSILKDEILLALPMVIMHDGECDVNK